MQEKIRGGILGLAVADALGVPVEFKSRESLLKSPVTDMFGHGTYNQPEGTWSDDTSMILCLVDSLSNDGLDYKKIMDNFAAWVKHGDYTPYQEVFDIGNATKQAVVNYIQGIEPFKCGGRNDNDNGNGSLMRILPIAFYIVGKYGLDCETATIVDIVHKTSSLTHGHMRSQIACGIYVMIAIELIKGRILCYAIQNGIQQAFSYYSENHESKYEIKKYTRVKSKGFKDLKESEIKSSGYVVDTLEAALWCLLNTDNYKDCVLKAVNLGEDTDTVAAVAGGLAGIAYGIKQIPEEWLSKLVRREYIEQLCDAFTVTVYADCTKMLSEYKLFFEQATKTNCCEWRSGDKVDENTYSFAYPVYCKELNAFTQMVERTYFWKNNYIEIIENNGLKMSDDLVDAIERADEELLGAILTSFIRQERFCDGLIASAVEQKVFLKIINRLESFNPICSCPK